MSFFGTTNLQENPFLMKLFQLPQTTAEVDGYFTVPMTSKVNYAPTNEGGGASSSIPLVDPNAVKTEEKGLTVEKTVPTADTKTTPAEIKKQEDMANYTIRKKERDFSDVMALSAKGEAWKNLSEKEKYEKWIKLSEEDKQKETINFLENTPEEEFAYCGGRKGWFKSMLVKNKNMDCEETRVLVGAIKYFDTKDEQSANLQADVVNLTGAKDAVNKKVAQTQVVEDAPKYAKKGQKAAIDVTTSSEYDDVKIGISKKISDLDETLHLYGVQKSIEGSKTSSKDVQKQIGLNLVEQYGKYSKDAEVEIHKALTNTGIDEVAQKAASYINRLHSENQNAASAISSSATTSSTTTTTTTTSPSIPSTSSVTSETVSSNANSENTSSATKTNYEKVAEILAQKTPDASQLKDIIKTLSDAEKIELLKQHPNNGDLIHMLLNSNPSMAILAEISKYLKDSASIEKLGAYTALVNNIGFLNASVQSALVKASVTPNLIKRNLLQNSVKIEYDKKFKTDGVTK